MPPDGVAKALARVARAVVRLREMGGLGVVVPGRMILTAGHCVSWSATGEMTLGNRFIERIETPSGVSVIAQVRAIEPIADIAVLGAIDEQGAREAEAFEQWCDSVRAVGVSTADLRPRTPYRCWIHRPKGPWIEGRAHELEPESETLYVKTRSVVDFGASGGPCVGDDGLLLGVVSNSSPTTSDMILYRPHLALPGRILRTILDPDWRV